MRRSLVVLGAALVLAGCASPVQRANLLRVEIDADIAASTAYVVAADLASGCDKGFVCTAMQRADLAATRVQAWNALLAQRLLYAATHPSGYLSPAQLQVRALADTLKPPG